jgi:hypothetical protein
MKKNNLHGVIDYSFRLALFLAILLTVQAFIYKQLGHSFFMGSLIVAYSFNLILALVFYSLVQYFEKRILPQLGYAFLGFSLLKFILFLIVLYPEYKTDGKLRSIEFASFFIPYAFCLFYETRAVIHRLNRSE